MLWQSRNFLSSLRLCRQDTELENHSLLLWNLNQWRAARGSVRSKSCGWIPLKSSVWSATIKFAKDHEAWPKLGDYSHNGVDMTALEGASIELCTVPHSKRTSDNSELCQRNSPTLVSNAVWSASRKRLPVASASSSRIRRSQRFKSQMTGMAVVVAVRTQTLWINDTYIKLIHKQT